MAFLALAALIAVAAFPAQAEEAQISTPPFEYGFSCLGDPESLGTVQCSRTRDSHSGDLRALAAYRGNVVEGGLLSDAVGITYHPPGVGTISVEITLDAQARVCCSRTFVYSGEISPQYRPFDQSFTNLTEVDGSPVQIELHVYPMSAIQTACVLNRAFCPGVFGGRERVLQISISYTPLAAE